MAISQSRYVQINTVASATNSVQRKELIGRFITSSAALSANEIITFTSLADVLTVFGSTSTEYAIAVKYYAYLNSQMTASTNMSFANYHPTAVAAYIKPTIAVPALASLTSIEDGSLTVTLGGETKTISSLDFSAATDLATIASTMQTAIRAAAATAIWTAATVSFVANVGLVLTAGTTGADSTVSYAGTADSGTDISNIIGWGPNSTPILSQGADAETAVEAVARIMDSDSNCGSFAFIDSLTNTEITNVAAWNSAQGVEFMYSVGVTSNYATIQSAVADYTGTALTYSADGLGYYMPMAIMAATNYDVTNGTVCYLYKQFSGETPAVTSDTMANTLDAIQVNYYGQTQAYAQKIAFYQRGFLQGELHDMGLYANELWLKSSISAACLNLFLIRNRLPANNTGAAILRTIIQASINQALDNGSIMPGKELSSTQISKVYEITGDDTAYKTIEQNGYWLGIKVVQTTVNSITEYQLQYTLVYAGGDSIRKIIGYDIIM